MNKEIHAEEVKRHIQCCIDTENCIFCSFFKEGCDKSTFGKLMLNAIVQFERERDEARNDLDTINYANTELYSAYEAMKRVRTT